MMSLTWIRLNGCSSVPADAVIAGRDIDGATIYVGRGIFEGEIIPAAVVPDNGVVCVPHNGKAVYVYEYEVLCGYGMQWECCESGAIPADAVFAAIQKDGEPLYVGRANVDGCLVTGKVHPAFGCIFVPFHGREHKLNQYEVLTMAKSTLLPSPLQPPSNAAGNDLRNQIDLLIMKIDRNTNAISTIENCIASGKGHFDDRSSKKSIVTIDSTIDDYCSPENCTHDENEAHIIELALQNQILRAGTCTSKDHGLGNAVVHDVPRLPKAIYVSRLQPTVTADHILDYIKRKIPDLDENDVALKILVKRNQHIEQLTFVSFRLLCAGYLYEPLMSPTFWPEHVFIGEFLDKPKPHSIVYADSIDDDQQSSFY